MKVSILNLHCLNALCDDRESVPGIVADVRLSTHGNITVDDVAACMHELASEGLVVGTVDASGVEWFQLTEKGRHELDTNWVTD
ncbi:MAG: hypothetical protein EBZ74_07650 [Planctomycetia bacterium]|nr:hypothetical protein [Planctomycetia bacterium]